MFSILLIRRLINNQGRRLMTERSWVLITLNTEWMKRKRIKVAKKVTPEKN